MRSSDLDAALYWLARMLEAGEDRLYIARRLVRMAIEDIGMADPRALEQAVAAHAGGALPRACRKATRRWRRPPSTWRSRRNPMPRTARSTARANGRADTVAEPVPLHLRNAADRSMKEWGYGEGYRARPHERGRAGHDGVHA